VTAVDSEVRDSANAHHSRTLLVTYLGAIVRRMGDWTPIAGTVELMGQCGLDAPGVRTAVFRLKKRGWLSPETRVGGRRGYGLTAQARTALAAGDEVVWHARPAADLSQGWCVVNFSVPESARAKRHQLRAHLTSLGFGNVGSAMWLAPARMQLAAEQAIAELGLTTHCAIFVGEYAGGQDLTTLLHASWDFGQINERYREFIARFEPESRRLSAAGVIDPEDAFAVYLRVIDHWRRLAYRDPGLPPEFFDERWPGPHAGRLFEGLVSALEGRALAHAATYW
jgi:phenylacetic acid degradation operon negative regulatory protein